MSANMAIEKISVDSLEDIQLTAAEEAECRAKAKAWIEAENEAARHRRRIETMLKAPEVKPARFDTIFGDSIFRSSPPTRDNVSALHRWGFKTVISLSDKPLCSGYRRYLSSQNASVYNFSTNHDKEGNLTDRGIIQAMSLLVNPVHYPIIIHCDDTCYRTAALVGLFRLVQGLPEMKVVEDYEKFLDEQICDDDACRILYYKPEVISMLHDQMISKLDTPLLRLAYCIEINTSTKKPAI
jgi:Tyrosine phosphatase family